MSMNFDDVKAVEVEVRIDGKDYILKEASGEAAVRYRNALLKSTRLTDGKVSGVDGLADAEPILVSLCLFERAPGKEDLSMPVHFVRRLPNRVMKKLYEWVKEVSNLDDPSDERSLLAEALGASGSPVHLDALQEYVLALPSEKYGKLKTWMKPTPEEQAKNSPGATTGGSV